MDTVRAWKDPEYRRSLGEAAPAHPAGDAKLIPITDAELNDVSGAATNIIGTLGCCGCVPWYSGFTVCGLVCGGKC